jgi:hypothetical protein
MAQGPPGMPSWFLTMDSTGEVTDDVLEGRMRYVFAQRLVKAENRKFPGSYFVGSVCNTMRRHFSDYRLNELMVRALPSPCAVRT